MATYLALWEIDASRMPEDPEQRGAGWSMLMALVRQHIESGIFTSWGSFVGEESGFAVCEGSEVDVFIALEQYVPFARFRVHPVASEEQTNEIVRALQP